MKRNNLLLVSALLLSVTLASFASAAYFPDARSLSQSVIDGYISVGEPILQALFGGYGGWSGFLLFERFLIFILLASIIYVVISKSQFQLFENQKAVKWIIAIIVPLIAMRFINYDQLEAILQQYQLLGIVLSSILPLLIFFYFVHSLGADYPILRKILWIFFIAIYVGLWSTGSETQSTIYFWTFIVAVLFLLFDTRIEIYLNAREFAKKERWQINSKIAAINEEINKLNRQITTGAHPNPRDARREMHELELQKKYLRKFI